MIEMLYQMKLWLVLQAVPNWNCTTGQINDDHNDDVENITLAENAEYALFYTIMNWTMFNTS